MRVWVLQNLNEADNRIEVVCTTLENAINEHFYKTESTRKEPPSWTRTFSDRYECGSWIIESYSVRGMIQ